MLQCLRIFWVKLLAVRSFRIFVPILSLFLLTSCLNRKDAIAPIVTIVSPPNGSVQSSQQPNVFGYAMDDEGIKSIVVNGQDLLLNEILKNERGKKLINFGFSPNNQDEGTFAANIVVTDINGRSSTFPYTLIIDKTPPTIEIVELRKLGNNRMRVHGIARDNDAVNSISIAGTSILLRATPEYEFNHDVDYSSDMNLVATDNAGNKTSVPLNP